MIRLVLWKLYRFFSWFTANSYKGVRLDDLKRHMEHSEWSDKPPPGWPGRRP